MTLAGLECAKEPNNVCRQQQIAFTDWKPSRAVVKSLFLNASQDARMLDC